MLTQVTHQPLAFVQLQCDALRSRDTPASLMGRVATFIRGCLIVRMARMIPLPANARQARRRPLVAPGMQWSNTAGVAPWAAKRGHAACRSRLGAPNARWRPKAQDPNRWRKTNVILPRHDLRERDHQRRQRHADHGLRGQTSRSWPVSGCRADPPSPGLERALHRDDAPVRASRLSRDLRQPLRTRGWRQRRQPRRRCRQGARRGRHRQLPDGRRYRRRREVDARAARKQRQGRPDRLLLGRAARLHLCLPEERHRCLSSSNGVAAW